MTQVLEAWLKMWRSCLSCHCFWSWQLVKIGQLYGIWRALWFFF